MHTQTTLLNLLTAAASLTTTAHALSGHGHSTRYWDCCKTSCAWSGKAAVSQPVATCDKNDSPLSDVDAKSGCDGGSAFACSDNSPWAVNDKVAYGFAATAIAAESVTCCACFKITFTSGPVKGKTMVVQSTNTGGDLGSNQFDLMMPGGGVGIFDGCARQYGQSLPGKQYGGVSSVSECAALPARLRAGCEWRFGWFQDADNPEFDFEQVQCPSEIVARSQCRRDDDASFPAFSSGGGSSNRLPASSSGEGSNPPPASSPQEGSNQPPVSSPAQGSNPPPKSPKKKCTKKKLDSA